MTPDERPDPRHVRAVSGALSEAERMWKGLPCRVAMRSHLDALQEVLSRMLDDTPDVPPPKTDATDAPPETDGAEADTMQWLDQPSSDAALDDALDTLGRPDALTLKQVHEVADEALAHWLKKHKVTVGQRLAGVGYVKIANPGAVGDGWCVGDRNTIVYARSTLTIEDRIAAARALAIKGRGEAKIPDANRGHRSRAAKSSQSAFSPSDPCPASRRILGQGK